MSAVLVRAMGGLEHHKHLLHRGLPAPALPPRLRLHKSCHSELHQGPSDGGCAAGHQGQRRGPGPGVDPTHPGHHASGIRLPIRSAGVADGACRPASGARSRLRLLGLSGSQLRQRRDPGRNRRNPSARESHHTYGRSDCTEGSKDCAPVGADVFNEILGFHEAGLDGRGGQLW